jgi:hypothetical protein
MANAFTARFRIIENTKRDNEKSPDRKLPIDFTVDQARRAAQYLLDAAKQAEADGTTIRVYKGKDQYEEMPGFTSWGSIWGESGSWSPLAVEPSTDMPF